MQQLSIAHIHVFMKYDVSFDASSSPSLATLTQAHLLVRTPHTNPRASWTFLPVARTPTLPTPTRVHVALIPWRNHCCHPSVGRSTTRGDSGIAAGYFWPRRPSRSVSNPAEHAGRGSNLSFLCRRGSLCFSLFSKKEDEYTRSCDLLDLYAKNL